MPRIITNKQKTKTNFILKKIIFTLVVILFFTFFIWLISTFFKSDTFFDSIELLSKKYDFLLTEVEVSDLKNISKIELNQYFKKYYNKSIFLIPIKEISRNIKKNNWIKSVTLKNNYKNKITIFIEEFEPIAVYYNGKSYLLISKSGFPIDFANDIDIQKFIILEGKNANKKASKLIEALPNKLKSTVIKAQFINNRRWDIYTKKNLRIKLPEIGYKKAMNAFIDIYDDLYTSDITDIEHIDLRIPEKAIIRFYD